MSRVPAMVGTIDRRLLINYRVDAEVLAHVLPSPFRPQLVGGMGVAGICMIRLVELRPAGMPRAVGLTTENAAHRVAVEWDSPDGLCRGVYIPRRDTASQLTVLLGGRLFPGGHHRARFRVHETEQTYDVALTSADGTVRVALTAHPAAGLPPGSVFGTLDEASTFFEAAPLGYSATHRPGRFEGLELQCATWRVQPLRVENAESSFFEDEALFPAGTVDFDSALVMRGIPATWRARGGLSAPGRVARSPVVAEHVVAIGETRPCA
jgi:hypothetical protein